jgi:hypothetical protein
MISIKYLKAVSCFDFDGYEKNPKKTIKFKENDNLDYCRLAPCQYYTLVPEIAETIYNVPWGRGTKSFPFLLKVLKCTDNNTLGVNSVQIITVDCEWRRRQFNNALETWWGEWINIEKTIDNILNDESTQEFFIENWNKYMMIDKNYINKKEWKNNKITMGEIIGQIKTGSVKICKNVLV